MDRRLVERAQRGDRAAFDELAHLTSDRLYAVAARILRDPEVAGDILQQTLISLWRDLPDLRDPERFDGWAYRVVVRQCHRHLRRRRQIPVTVELLPDEASVDDAHLATDRRDALERAFTRLSPDQRAVVVLLYYRGLTVPEIGTSLGISQGTVKSRLHSARAALRAALEADERVAMIEGRPA